MEDNIKRDWNETSVKGYNNPDIIKAIMAGKRKSALERLAERYRAFCTIGFLCAGSMPWLLGRPGILPDFQGKSLMLIGFALYFLLCGFMDLWLYRGIKSIDVATLTVKAVIDKSLYFRKRHLQFVAILLPLAFIIVAAMIYGSQSEGEEVIWGMIVGGVCGGAVGIRQFRKFMADYREITDDGECA